MEELPKNKKIILFDGVCNLCNTAVQFIIKRDKNDVFRFVAIQSNLGQSVLKHLNIDSSKTDSIILYVPNYAYYIKAEAALRIAKELNTWHSILYYFNIIPPIVKNTIYDSIATNRYKWYGKKEHCMVPTSELKAKFLE